MGGCFSSGSYEEAECRPSRVRPSDEDGKWPCVGERNVDTEAEKYIANFHRNRSGCTAVQPKPAPDAA